MSNEEIINVLGRLADGAEACAIAPREPETERKKHKRSAKAIREAISLLKQHLEGGANEPQGDGWIGVEDELPEPLKDVLVFYPFGNGGGPMVDMSFCFHDGSWLGGGLYGQVTHWHPLPTPPKED